MPDVEITVLDHAGNTKIVGRPLYRTEAGYAVTFRRQKWPIDHTLVLDIRKTSPLPETARLAFATAKDRSRLLNSSAASIHNSEQRSELKSGNTYGAAADSAAAPDSVNWDADQIAVIRADANAKLIVEAGPGTGKTAVACARLAQLISEHDVEPSKTWMISFTRTAVAEIRARLHGYLHDASFAIRIATIDSYAWSIHSGHDPDARLSGTYEENIERVIELLTTDEDVGDELSQIEHVVIDEAQDIIGVRADLIEALIKKLSPDCGITVFVDQAQAIYGFSNDRNAGQKKTLANATTSLLDRLAGTKDRSFKILQLHEVHRTSSANLKKIFSEIRKEVLDVRNRREGVHSDVAQRIVDLADGSGLKWSRLKVADFTADHLILFRTRAEVLLASQFCDRPHRLRLSGFGATLPPWLAICFHDFSDQFLANRAFLDLWSARIENKAAPEYGPAEAWKRLVRVAGRKDGSIDMRKLRQRLSHARPPIELSAPEYGLQGPTVGTIHASKGREASNVILLLPKGVEFDSIEQEAEEARVLFVGATRAKTSLIVGEGSAFRASTLSSGRIFRTARNGESTMVEVGHHGDITPRGLVGRGESDAASAAAAQAFLARVADVVTTYALQADPEMDWRYRLLAGESGICIGVMSANFTGDLWEVLRSRDRGRTHRPPTRVRYVRAQGCSTIVLGPDDAELEALNEPWASSGFMLAPRIAAFPPFFFPSRR